MLDETFVYPVGGPNPCAFEVTYRNQGAFLVTTFLDIDGNAIGELDHWLLSGIMRSMADASVRVVQAFNDATNRHDIDAMLALVSDDILFESTAPPDGERLVGKSSVRQVWEGIFRESPNARVETEDLIVCADRCIALVCYVFDHENPDAGHVRAVDVLRVEHGKISEKLSYVKG